MSIFCAVLCFILQPLLEQWHDQGFGVSLGRTWIALVGYADDQLIIARNLCQASVMVEQFVETLRTAGLDVDRDSKKN
eukprot:3195622-Karenia_brevis.AAC.1